jgi:hypothetical protein
MSTGAIVGIIIAVIVVAALVVLGPALLRQMRMRRQFGPEYDRLAKELGSRKATAELTARQRRADALGIHPLSPEQQARSDGAWAVRSGSWTPRPRRFRRGHLIWDVMRDRAKVEDRDASVEALSVYHARALDGYRQAQDIRTESASTEELRTAMIRYRTLFQDLVGVPAGQGVLQRPAAATGQPAARTDGHTGKIAIVPPKTADTPR